MKTPSAVPIQPSAGSLKQTVCGFDGPSSVDQVNPPSYVKTRVAPSWGINHPWICCGSLPPAIPQPCVAVAKWIDRSGTRGSPDWRQVRPPSVVLSSVRVASAHPVVALMKSTPTNSSVDPYCFAQRVPSVVAKIAWAPTAQPSRGPTIWMAASAGTKPGSTPDGVTVGVGDAESVAEGVGDGDASEDGEALGVELGESFTAAV